MAIDRKLSNEVFEIIATEVGIPKNEINEDSEFSDLGVDGALSKIIISKISKTVKADLPSTIFVECPNVRKLQLYLERLSIHVKLPPNTMASIGANSKLNAKPADPLSILLQGRASARKTIFLLPDGSGSGMAYMLTPNIAQDVCLIGMNSPFLNAVSNCPSRLEDLAPIWVKEIRSRQAVGPYILGGWSAGGYYSFEVAKQLIKEGDTVEKLILIDSPCRLVFEALPMAVVNYLSSHSLMGNWGDKKAPAWMMEHFDTTIKTISRYMPTPLEAKTLPEVFIIWARDGVLKEAGVGAAETGLDINIKVTRFMLDDKDDQDPYGWDKLFPGAKISIAGMPGNHFSLVYPPNSASLSSLLRDAIKDHAVERKGSWRLIRGTHDCPGI